MKVKKGLRKATWTEFSYRKHFIKRNKYFYDT